MERDVELWASCRARVVAALVRAACATLAGAALLAACAKDPSGARCTTNGDCVISSYCDKAACGDETGVCRPKPPHDDCPRDFSQTCVDAGVDFTTCAVDAPFVCGCDHQTYRSACEAASYGASIASQGVCPEPPSGACMSQDDCGGDSYAALVYCRPSRGGDPAGFCTRRTSRCSTQLSPVCGCDGKTYRGRCESDPAAVGVAYTGPCRSGAITACDADRPCPAKHRCVDDPRASCAPGTACPGVCLTAEYYGFPCGQLTSDVGLQVLGCSESVCVAAQPTECAGGPCAFCISGTDVPCDATTPCPTDQLCVPTPACHADGRACPNVCVRP
jgi:hypothetical protein